MSFVQRLFKGRTALPEAKTQLDPERLRVESTEAFQRLKAKFSESGVDVRAGLNTNNLTFGDLVDILLVYYEATQFDSRCNFRSLYDIAKYLLNLSAFDPELLINEEMVKLLKSSPTPNELDRTNVLYTLPVDLAT